MEKISFGTDGWRGILASDFTFGNVEKVTQAIACYLHRAAKVAAGVVVGYDTRFLAENFALRGAEVLAGNGIPVLLTSRATPTPVVAFSVKYYQAAGAVMITASHNPPEYLGLKFIPAYAGPAVPEITSAIEHEISSVFAKGEVKSETIPEAQKRGLLRFFNPQRAYFNHLCCLIKAEQLRAVKLKVVVDPLYGAGIGYLEDFLQEVGWTVKVLHNCRDPLFGGGLPDPNAETLKPLGEEVVREGAALGLALDGDADRFGVVGSEGEYYLPNQVLTLILAHFLNTRPLRGPVARTVATTHMLDRVAASCQLPVEETPVGFKYLGQSLLQGSIFGGEESGGLSIQGHVPEKDGILANLLVAEMVAAQGVSLKEIYQQMTRKFNLFQSKRWDFQVAPAKKQEINARLTSFSPFQINGIPVVQRVDLDGRKFVLADASWFLVRPSGTEPVFRLYVEAPTAEAVTRIQNEVKFALGLEE